jgi:L-amino acid N-acyltransferase YncA
MVVCWLALLRGPGLPNSRSTPKGRSGGWNGSARQTRHFATLRQSSITMSLSMKNGQFRGQCNSIGRTSRCAAIGDIYNFFVSTSTITFEEETVPTSEIARRIEEVQSAGLPWLVAEEARVLSGYAHAKPWRPRSAYRFSEEITVYVDPRCVRRGIGSRLYGQLFPLLQARGVDAVIGGIALPNDPSVALDEKLGLRNVAQFKEMGFKFDRWIDVG